MALSERDQKIIALPVLLALAAGMYWYLAYSPQQLELDVRRAQVDSLMQLNREIQMLSAGGDIEAMQEEADLFERELTAMRRLVPAQNELPGLLESITAAARGVGLDVSGFAPNGMLPGDHFDVYKYKFSVVGQYHRVGAFLARVGSLDRIVVPMNLTLGPGPPSIGERRPGRNEVFVKADFDIQTFVAKTAPPSVAAAAGTTAGGM